MSKYQTMIIESLNLKEELSFDELISINNLTRSESMSLFAHLKRMRNINLIGHYKQGKKFIYTKQQITNIEVVEEINDTVNVIEENTKVEKLQIDTECLSLEAKFEKITGLNFNKFYAKYYKKLVWHIKKYNIDTLDAEGIANDTFVDGLEKIDQYNSDYNFSTWLFTIGKNNALQFKNKKQRVLGELYSCTIGSDEEEGDYNPLTNIASNIIDDHSDVVEYNNKINSKYKLSLTAISKLQPKYREYLELVDIQGKSYEEIKEIMNTDLQTVKNRIHHGRKKIKKSLKYQLNEINKI